jgi:hypothetical protein
MNTDLCFGGACGCVGQADTRLYRRTCPSCVLKSEEAFEDGDLSKK